MRRHSGSEKRREKARAAWGANLNSVADVVNVFVKYTSGAPLPAYVCTLQCSRKVIVRLSSIRTACSERWARASSAWWKFLPQYPSNVAQTRRRRDQCAAVER